MYIWNIRAVILAAKEQRFTNKQKKIFNVLLWTSIVVVIVTAPWTFDFSTFNRIDWIDFGSYVSLYSLSFYMMYRMYRREKKSSFWYAFIGLSIPTLLYTIILVFILSTIGYFVIYDFLPYQSLYETNMLDLTISLIATLVSNGIMLYGFKKIFID